MICSIRAATRFNELSRWPVVTVSPTVWNTAAIAIVTIARIPTATITSISVNARPTPRPTPRPTRRTTTAPPTRRIERVRIVC